MNGQVIVDGERWPFRNYSAVYASSVSEMGLNFKVFYYAKEPDKFHAIGFSLPLRSILRYVPSMFLGRPSGCPDLIEKPAREMIVELEEPLGYTIDGDMHPPCSKFHIKTGPRLDIIVE